MRLEQAQIVAGTMEDAMHVDRFALNGIEDQVVLDDEIAISQTEESFLIGNASQVGILGKAGEAFLDSGGESFCCRRPFGSNIGHDFSQVILGNPKEPNGVLRLIHGSAFGDPSSPEQVADPYHRPPVVTEQRLVY